MPKTSMELKELPKVRNSTKSDCYIAKCVHCDDVSGHVEVDTKKKLYYCVRCGVGGRIYGQGLKDERVGMPPPDPKTIRREMGDPVTKGTAHWDYLRERGFNETLIRRLQPHLGPEAWRVYFPIYALSGARMLQTGRAIKDVNPKWWFPAGKPGAHQFLYGAERIQPGLDELVVVEGIFDAAWDPKRVAIFGSNMSPYQINILTQDLRPKAITLALDRDAFDKMKSLATRISMIWSCKMYIAVLPEGKDPCDLGYDGMAVIEDLKEEWI